ncbi:hypothetical protein VTG60DRAFT_6752 [Thermothelomyces hinnuleus]
MTAKGLVLVTGANGYIAGRTVEALLKAGYSVRGTVRKLQSVERTKEILSEYADKLEFVEVPDITAPGAFDDAVKGVDVVAHLASPISFDFTDPEPVLRNAVNGTVRALESAVKEPKIRTFVLMSSIAAMLQQRNEQQYTYTDADWNNSSEAAVAQMGKATPGPIIYAASKAAVEKALWAFRDEHKPSFTVTSINPCFVAGPALVPPATPGDINRTNRLIPDVYSGMPLEEAGRKGALVRYVDVRDAARLVVFAVEPPGRDEWRRPPLAGPACSSRKNVPEDPMFQLAFPQPAMLHRPDLERIMEAMRARMSRAGLQQLAEEIRRGMNPHPANRKAENVPRLRGAEVPGMQHKYRETVLFFPSEGQLCHAFCTYCFRWAQFTSVGSSQTFKSSDARQLRDYLARNRQVRDVLFTGGDPMVMSPHVLAGYLDPLISGNNPNPRANANANANADNNKEDDDLKHLERIRIGSKSLAWWPYKYTGGGGLGRTVAGGAGGEAEAAEVLRLFERVEAVRLIRMTGVQVHGQAPLIRHVNDDPKTWRRMWELQVRLGIVPYYMFVERDTGASHYWSVPLDRAHRIFNTAYSRLTGTARTVRGPSMSASPGKVGVIGVENVGGEDVFVLKFWQARGPSWIGRVFFAKCDPEATWLSDLVPAFGEKEFFLEPRYREIVKRTADEASGQLLDLD